ncbi:hypothetical protein GWK48_10095 [Metallosphaera tengchongensis]|uniref:DUF3782 domain-containing protein n=1 Tax=Metallosphaera tengchongensis TaxID=1532350 RepID=A0A6N0P023_9CREN|nr:hypothetical protein [Metallosphaera tengchongensis]QKR00691.1 hypothetical protein GWK48_10095 [Metallosphaera tengchongensis]
MASESDEITKKLLEDPKFISVLADKIYDKLKDEVVIKKLEENTEAIRKLQGEVKGLQEAVKQQGDSIKALQEAVKQQGEILKEHSEAVKGLQEAVKQQGDSIKALQEAVKQQGEILKEHSEAVKGLQEAVKQLTSEVKELDKLMIKLSTEVGSFTNRAGKGLEKTIMMIYKEALELHGVDPDKVKHGNIIDTLGIIDKGRIFEVDFYETNDYVYVFEIKNFADEGALEQMVVRKKLIPQLFNKPVKLFLVANYIDMKVKKELEKEGVTIISSMTVE